MYICVPNNVEKVFTEKLKKSEISPRRSEKLGNKGVCEGYITEWVYSVGIKLDV